jgi:hypothetical protein
VTRDGCSLREGEDGGGGTNFGGANGIPVVGVYKRAGGEGGKLTASAKRKKGVKGERQRGWPLLQWHGGEAEDGGQAARDATW